MLTSHDIEMDIERLIRQETAHYRISDYIRGRGGDTTRTKQQLVTLVEECASIIDGSSSSSTDHMKRELSTDSLTDVQKVSYDQKKDTTSISYWRQQMFDWAIMVVDSFGADREIVIIAFNLIDRFVAQDQKNKKSASLTRDDFQLYCMTSVYIAVKVIEPYPRKLSVKALVDMSRGFYSEEDVTAAEMEILNTLNWRITPPTPLAFAKLYCEYCNQQVSIVTQQSIAALIEFAVADSSFLSFSASDIGLAACLMALNLEGKHNEMKQMRDALSNVSQDLETAYLLLEKLYCH